MGVRKARVVLGVGTLFLLAASARAQNFSVLFSENFEAPPGPAGTVGSYTETDAFGLPAPTLWHRDGFCDSVPLGGYGATPSAVPFSSIAGLPGTILVWGAGVNDFTSSTASLPAPFSFFSVAKTTYRLNNNGWLTFAVPGSGFGTNSPIPTTGAPDDAIFAWWDDLVTRPGGSLRSLAVPGGDLIAEWNSEEKFPAGGTESATFQIVLHPAPANTIEIRYDYASFVSSAANPWDATVGVENAAGTGGNDLTGLGTANSVFPAQNLLLTPLPPAIPTIPASMGTGAAAYNRGDLGLYDYNTAPFSNAGAIESPVVVSTAPNTALYLLFDTTRQVDPGAGTTFDQSYVEVAPAGTGIWTAVAQLTASPTCTGPAQRNVFLLPFSLAGTSFQHRFRFDSVDANANGFRGWYVDNVRIDQLLAVTSPVFSENFDTGSVPGSTVGTMTEEDLAGFPAPTLWHDEPNCDLLTPLPAPLAGLAAAYHQGDIGNYTFNTGGANEGAISSAVLPVPGGSSIFDLAFDYLKEGEGGGTATFDQCFVDMREGTGGTWSTALQLTGNQTCASGPGSVSFSANGGPFSPLVSAGTGQFRLRFDTVDGIGNAFLGWVVDNFAVNGRATAASLPIGAPCPGSGGCSPSITGVGLPYPGNPAFQLRLNGGLPGASAILVLGLSMTGPPCFLSLPFPIGVFLPGNACSLAVCPESILPGFVVSGAAPCEGSASLSVAIPATAPPGAAVFAQWFVIDATVFPSPATLAATPSLLVTLL